MKRLARVVDEEPLLVILLAGFAAIFLAVFPPHLLVADSFLTLTAGREVAEHGIPTEDTLTVIAAGETWVDQQWGAQLLAYAAYQVGGYAVLALLAGTFVVGAFAIAAIGARSLGAGPRAIVLIFFPVILAAPWAWTIRAQVFALPLYTVLVWLLATEARHPSRKAYLAIPLLVVWANVHGSVLLGAAFTMTLAAIELVSRRPLPLWRCLSLLALAPLAVLATPYGPLDTARYYRLMLSDPPFADRVTEWQPSDPGSDTIVFYVLAVIAAIVLVRCRRRARPFDVAALVISFAGAVLAIRGIPWFALACMTLLPVLLGTRLEGAAAPVRSGLNRALAAGAATAVAITVGAALIRDSSWYEDKWPNAALDLVSAHSSDPSQRVFATDRHADWLLWNVPELRGRIAFDVRFELYDEAFFDGLAAYKLQRGDWKAIAAGYRVVVVDEGAPQTPTDGLLAEPGARELYGDDQVTVVLRPASS